MHLEVSSDEAVKCVSEQTKEILKSKYFKEVHKGHTASVVLWNKNGITSGDLKSKEDLLKNPKILVDIGESDEKSEISAILSHGLCWSVPYFTIDAILKEKYPEIAIKVDRQIEEKMAKSSNNQRKTIDRKLDLKQKVTDPLNKEVSLQ